LKILLAIVAGVAVVAAGFVVVAIAAVLVLAFLLIRSIRRRFAGGKVRTQGAATRARRGADVIEVSATEVRTDAAALPVGGEQHPDAARTDAAHG
jgi:hypothetical protein